MSDARVVTIVVLVLLVLVWVSLLAVYGPRHPWRDHVGRLLLATWSINLVTDLALLGLAVGKPWPEWAYPATLSGVLVVAVGWLVLLWRTRRKEESRNGLEADS